MTTDRTDRTDVTDYVASLDGPGRDLVARLVDRARALAPEASEGRSYGMAALLHTGKPLVAVVVRTRGLSVYPYSSRAVAQAVKVSPGLDASKGAVRFTVTQPIPDDAFDAMVRARLAEIEES